MSLNIWTTSLLQAPCHFYQGASIGLREVIPVSITVFLLSQYYFHIDPCLSFSGLNQSYDFALDLVVKAPVFEEAFFRGYLQQFVAQPFFEIISF